MTTHRLPACTLRQTLAFLRDPAAFTAGPGLALGDLYRVRIPGYRIHVVTRPDLVDRILVRDADRFVKSRIYWRQLRRSMGDSLGTLDGERWSYLHRVQRPFFTPVAVRGYLPVAERSGRRHLEEMAASSPAGERAVVEALSELNARVVLQALFGQDDGPLPRGMVERVAEANRIIDRTGKYPWRPAVAWVDGTRRRAEALKRFFTEYVRGLDDGVGRGAPEDLLAALTRALRDPQAPPLPGALVRNEVMFHLGASMETQAAAGGWALYLLWRHPEALARLRREVDAVADRGPVGADHVDALVFTRQVIQETLRLYPPVYGVVRDAAHRVEVGGVAARPGDTFLVSVYGLHRNPRLWEEPDAFRPERFAPGAPAGARYRYLPFGAGRHICIGRHLALSAMTLTVAQIAQRFEWSFPGPPAVPRARPTLKPAEPFLAAFTPRP